MSVSSRVFIIIVIVFDSLLFSSHRISSLLCSSLPPLAHVVPCHVQSSRCFVFVLCRRCCRRRRHCLRVVAFICTHTSRHARTYVHTHTHTHTYTYTPARTAYMHTHILSRESGQVKSRDTRVDAEKKEGNETNKQTIVRIQ